MLLNKTDLLHFFSFVRLIQHVDLADLINVLFDFLNKEFFFYNTLSIKIMKLLRYIPRHIDDIKTFIVKEIKKRKSKKDSDD